jgi:hypothetical protein
MAHPRPFLVETECTTFDRRDESTRFSLRIGLVRCFLGALLGSGSLIQRADGRGCQGPRGTPGDATPGGWQLGYDDRCAYRRGNMGVERKLAENHPPGPRLPPGDVRELSVDGEPSGAPTLIYRASLVKGRSAEHAVVSWVRHQEIGGWRCGEAPLGYQLRQSAATATAGASTRLGQGDGLRPCSCPCEPPSWGPQKPGRGCRLTGARGDTGRKSRP